MTDWKDGEELDVVKILADANKRVQEDTGLRPLKAVVLSQRRIEEIITAWQKAVDRVHELEVELEKARERKWSIFTTKRIGPPDDPYLVRFRILQTPFFSIFFHRIFRPDKQREVHDHPWTFFSLILRGRYEEDVPTDFPDENGGSLVRRIVRWFNFKRAEGRHTIRSVSRVPVWTLVFTGPERREWGFWIPELCDEEPGCVETGQRHGSGCRLSERSFNARHRFIPWTKYRKLNDA